MKRLSWLLIAIFVSALAGCGSSHDVTGPSAGQSPWSRNSAGLPGAGSCQALTASGPTLLAGIHGYGVFRSTDGGLNWTVATNQPSDVPEILSLTAQGMTVLVGTGAGVSRSTDGGSTWTRLDSLVGMSSRGLLLPVDAERHSGLSGAGQRTLS